MTDTSKAQNTNRQLSSIEYSGSADSQNSKPRSYADIYNATLNEVREEVLKQREPNQSNISLSMGVEDINIRGGKNEEDYINTRNPNRTKLYDNRASLENCSITNFKDQLDNCKISNRIEAQTLNSLKSNPYATSIINN